MILSSNLEYDMESQPERSRFAHLAGCQSGNLVLTVQNCRDQTPQTDCQNLGKP
jgi:hypothetical protein